MVGSPNPYSSPSHLFFNRTESPVRWFALALLCLTGMGPYYSLDIQASLKREVSNRLSIDNVQFNLLYSISSFPVVILTWAAGFLVDKMGRVGMLLIFAFVLLGAQSLYAFGIQFRHYYLALIGRLLMGTSANCLWVSQSKILALWFSAGRKELALGTGLLFSFFRLCTAANDYASPALEKAYDVSVAVWIGSIACAVTVLAALLLTCLERWADLNEKELDDPLLSPLHDSSRPTTDGAVGRGVELRAVGQFPALYWLLCVLAFLLYASVMSFNNICGDYLQEKYHYDVEEADRIMGIPFFLSAATFPFVGWLVDRFGKRPLFLSIAAALITTAHALFAETSMAPYVSVCFLGLAYVCFACALWPSIPYLIPQQMLGTAYGICTCSFNLGLAVTPLIVGYLKDHYSSYYWVEILFSCLGVSALGLSLIVWVIDISNGDGGVLSVGRNGLSPAPGKGTPPGARGAGSGNGSRSERHIAVPGVIDDDFTGHNSSGAVDDLYKSQDSVAAAAAAAAAVDDYHSMAADLRPGGAGGAIYVPPKSTPAAAMVDSQSSVPGLDGVDVVDDDLNTSVAAAAGAETTSEKKSARQWKLMGDDAKRSPAAASAPAAVSYQTLNDQTTDVGPAVVLPPSALATNGNGVYTNGHTAVATDTTTAASSSSPHTNGHHTIAISEMPAIDKPHKTAKSPPDHTTPNPEESAAWYHRIWFSWLSPLISVKASTVDDEEFMTLRRDLYVKSLTKKFDPNWDAQRALPKPSLLRALAATFGPAYYLAGFVKMLADLLMLCAPVILSVLVAHVKTFDEEYGGQPEPAWIGYMLACSLFVVIAGGSILMQHSAHVTAMTAIQVKSTLVMSIYRKILTLSPAARAEMSTGKIVTMMASDTARIDIACQWMHFAWTAMVQAFVIVMLLYRSLGVAAFAGVGVLACLVPFQVWVIRTGRRLRRSTLFYTDQRIRAMNEILQGVRLLKMYSWERSFLARVNEIREKEMILARNVFFLQGINSGIMLSSPIMMSLSAFLVMTNTGGVLTAEAIFPAIVLFTSLRQPLFMLPNVFGMVADCSVALDRLQLLLTAKELEGTPPVIANQPHAVRIANADFSWEVTEHDPDNPSDLHKMFGAEPGKKEGGKGGDPLATPATRTSKKKGDTKKSDVELTGSGEAKKKEVELTANLRNITMSVPKGSLFMIVGQVGSGKSSLLSALLGEMKKLTGELTLSGSIGYVSQQAWIQNATLKQNILFGQPFDAKKYETALRVSALQKDLEILPDGDETEIGERGINLSGGQKQRVSLARAVYFDADTILLDDPLSAVDAHVAKFLFNELIAGLLTSKTRILVTHQLHFVRRADYIVVMRDGTIAEQGTFNELMNKSKGELAGLMATHGGGTDEEKVDTKSPAASESKSDKAAAVAAIARRKSSANKPGGTPKLKPAASPTGEPASPGSDGSPPAAGEGKTGGKHKLMTTEERAKGQVEGSVFRYYFNASGGIIFALLICFNAVITQSLRVGVDYWLTLWSNDAFHHADEPGWYMKWFAIIGLSQCVSNVCQTMQFAHMGYRAARVLHRRALTNVLRAPTSFFDTTPIGRIMNRFSRDQDVIDSALTESMRMFMNTLSQSASTLLLVCIVSPWSLLPVSLAMTAYYRTQNAYREVLREAKRLESITRSPVFAHFSETLTGLSTIRAYREQAQFVLSNATKLDKNARAYMIQLSSLRWAGGRLETCGAFITFSAALMAVLGSGSISPGLLGLSVAYALNMTQPLTNMVRQSAEVESNMNSVERTRFYTDSIPQERDSIIEGKRPPENWPSNGTIQFKNFSLRYRDGLPLVIHDVSLTINSGEKVGVIGRTGAGKSTLLLGLFRLVEAAAGHIEVDGVNISEMGLEDVRSRLAVIPQDPVLYSGTVRSNLDPFSTHSDESIWKVLERSQLRPAIEALPSKLDAPVFESGENFSVGQRCQIGLARALLRSSKVLVMDEATASVDLETDAAIQQTIRSDFAHCTLLTIAHRLNTIVDYDRVLVMHNGRIGEFDTPANLLRNPNSMFSALVNETGPSNAQLLRDIAMRAEQKSFGGAAGTAAIAPRAAVAAPPAAAH